MLLVSSLFSKSVQDMVINFDMTTRRKVVFGYLQEPYAHDLLLAIPDGLGQLNSPVEY